MLTSKPLSLETEERLRAELNSREHLLWTGHPLVQRADTACLLLALFGIPYTVFSVFWVVIALNIATRLSAPTEPFSHNLYLWMLPLLGVPFILIGVGMISVPYRKRRNTHETVYALTDQRALIMSPNWRGRIMVRSIGPELLTARRRMTESDGSGSIIFPKLTTMQRAAGPDGQMYAVNVGFKFIADVREVDALMEQTYPISK